RAQEDAAGHLRNHDPRCAGNMMHDGQRRATTHYLNKAKRNGGLRCTFVATYLSDPCPGFEAGKMALRACIRRVIYTNYH
ncbi:MAG: hypothetical protein ACKPKO_38055, partial [Candidatus Fonsibacter sp.]